jgi:hypothetical protein
VSFEVLDAGTVTIIFTNVMPCNLVQYYRCIGATCYLYIRFICPEDGNKELLQNVGNIPVDFKESNPTGL